MLNKPFRVTREALGLTRNQLYNRGVWRGRMHRATDWGFAALCILLALLVGIRAVQLFFRFWPLSLSVFGMAGLVWVGVVVVRTCKYHRMAHDRLLEVCRHSESDAGY
jgi:hypothetical protein